MCETAARDGDGLRRGGRLPAVAALALPAPSSDVRRHALPAKPGRDEVAGSPGSWMGDGVDTVENSKVVLLWNNGPDEASGNIAEDMACC
jgi:hypothetical protein